MFLKKRFFWDVAEIVFAVIGAGCSMLAAVMPLDRKGTPASFAFISILLAGIFKWQSKRIENREKIETANNAQLIEKNYRDELQKLREETEIENERRNAEISQYKEKAEFTTKLVAKAVLEDFHKKYFKGGAKEEAYKHRTTLFVCAEFEGASGKEKRLAIFARAGVHPDSKSSWSVDDNDPEKCRGVAAQIWFHGAGIVKTAACDWPANGDIFAKFNYADSLGITVDEAEALNVKSKVFTGIQVIVRGEKWGVLLLDSLKDGHINEEKTKKKLVDSYAVLISSILAKTI